MPSSTPQEVTAARSPVSGPPVSWLAAGFLLAGLGTVLLGPILPTVSARWQLSDAQAGALLFTKFLGAFLGGSTVPRRLWTGILAGTLCTAAGLLAFSFAGGLWTAGPSLLLVGFGLGRLIASSNILAGRRYATHRSSALAALNFFWSLGAVGTGVLIGILLPHVRLPALLAGVAAAFVVTGLGGSANVFARKPEDAGTLPLETSRLTKRTLLLYGGLLVAYGGLETSLSSWLSTFDTRYLNERMLHGQALLVFFWAALTIGRALVTAVLRVVPEVRVLRLSLAAAGALVVALATLHGRVPVAVTCIGLGLFLAPWFPATFALLLQQQPTSREAGFILALSGIGAAVFPWLTGVVSTHAGSLRIAMAVPAALTALLLLATWLAAPEPVNTPH